MPPWYIEKDIGIQDFKNDPSLTEEEIEKIATWADNGAPLGNPADMPPPVAFIDVDEWEIGQPDLIVSSPSVEVKADAPDWWGAVADVETGLQEDRYVSAIEFKEITESRVGEGRQTVGGRFVFHHAVIRVVGPDFDEEDPLAAAGLSSWPVHEVGRNADVFDPKAGKEMVANSKITFPSLHLHANGAETRAHLDIGFKFHPRDYEPEVDQRLIAFGNGVDLDVEAEHPNQTMESYFVLPDHARIAVFEPHMHAPGVRMCLEAIYGTTDRDAQLLRLRPQLGPRLHLRGPRRCPCSRRAPSCTSPAGSTTRRRTPTFPIRGTGPAAATAPSIRCSSTSCRAAISTMTSSRRPSRSGNGCSTWCRASA